MSRALFTFRTTHMALWAEEVAGEAGLPVELVPAPPGSEALCDLALETYGHLGDEVAAALEGAGVTFSRLQQASRPPSQQP